MQINTELSKIRVIQGSFLGKDRKEGHLRKDTRWYKTEFDVELCANDDIQIFIEATILVLCIKGVFVWFAKHVWRSILFKAGKARFPSKYFTVI